MSAWRGNGMRDTIAKRQRNSHNDTRKANVEVREGAGPKLFRKEGEMRIPRKEGIRMVEKGAKGTGKREREAKETKEREIAIDFVPRYEARRNNMRRRTASTRSRIGVAGAVPTSLSPHSGAPMTAGGTPISPTAMATPCDNGVRYSPSLKIYSNPESPSSHPFFLSLFRLAMQASLALIRNVSFPLEGVRIDYEKMGKSRWPLLCDVKIEHVLALCGGCERAN